jgi:hypothetical protein
MSSKRKYKRKPVKRPVHGPKGLERGPVAVRSPSGLSYPIARGKLGMSLAER